MREAINPELRPFGIFRPSPRFHFYLLQWTTFLYLAYRLLSRDYTVYGFMPEAMFNYPRTFLMELWPGVPALHFTSFQFIYQWIERPSPDAIALLQWVGIGACGVGLLGILPRIAALTALMLNLHLTGFVQSSNAEIDGGCLVMATLLVLIVSPKTSFYRVGRPLDLNAREVDSHWPVFLFFCVAGAYYSMAGLNKVIDIGPHWPVVLHLENLAHVGIERSLFLAERYVNPWVSSMSLSPVLSVVSGVVTLIGEAGFISILFFPRFRLFFVGSMIALHFLVYLTAGINFMGNSLLLLLCLDWNAPVRRVTAYYDADCGFCEQWMGKVSKADWFHRIEIRTIQSLTPGEHGFSAEALQKAMGLRDENGDIYYGADAFEQIAIRCPLGYPYAFLVRIPGAIYVARWVYEKIAAKRSIIGPPASCATPDQS